MIRFACPTCGAAYSVGDDKAGKQGRCPKCQAAFVVPRQVAGAEAPLPAESVVEIAPCPGCQSRLSVDPADLGVDIQCPQCNAVYRAMRAGDVSLEPPATSLAPLPTPPPSTDPTAAVDIAPCPSCQARLLVNPSDLGGNVECPFCKTVYTATRLIPGALVPAPPTANTPPLPPPAPALPQATVRRRQTRREESRRDTEDDEDEDDRPRRRGRSRPRSRNDSARSAAQAWAIAAGVIHILYSTVTTGLGTCFLFGSSVLASAAVFVPARGRSQEDARDFVAVMSIFAMILSIGYIITGVIMFVAAIGCFIGTQLGRKLSFVAASIVVVLVVLSILSTLVNVAMQPEHLRSIGGAIIGVVIALVIWGGYAGFIWVAVTQGDRYFDK